MEDLMCLSAAVSTLKVSTTLHKHVPFQLVGCDGLQLSKNLGGFRDIDSYYYFCVYKIVEEP